MVSNMVRIVCAAFAAVFLGVIVLRRRKTEEEQMLSPTVGPRAGAVAGSCWKAQKAQARKIGTARDRIVRIRPGLKDWITYWAPEKVRKEAEKLCQRKSTLKKRPGRGSVSSGFA